MVFFWWIIFSILVGILGRNRSCGFFLAFVCSIILSPIIGLIITLLCKRAKTKVEYLAEAKILLEAGAINQLTYSKMVEDVMNTGKCKEAEYYQNSLYSSKNLLGEKNSIIKDLTNGIKFMIIGR